MDIGLLGPLEARDGTGRPLKLGGRKPRALLAVLLLNLNRTVSVETLVDDLWGESVPETATKAVQIYVSQLRKVLPRAVLQTRAPGYLIELPEEQVDLYRFERMLAAGRSALAAGNPRRASELLGEALALWRGRALGEFDEPFAEHERRRLEELRLAALEERIEADLALGKHADLVGELEALVGRNPLRERLRGQQMLALYRCGRQADALAAYQQFRGLLDDEVGIQPSGRLKQLQRQILRQDPELERDDSGAAAVEGRSRSRRPETHEPPEAPASASARPERKLEGRDVELHEHATTSGAAQPVAPGTRLMVGREAELERLREYLDDALRGQRRVVFVSGEAGQGKTTLVDAFLERVDDAELLVGRGQCIEHHGPGEPYMPMLEALGRLCRGPSGRELVALLSERAPTWLLQLPGLVDRDELEPTTQRAFGANRERMLREIVEALETHALRQPLVLVLEDLHWSDVSTVDLLASLAQRAEPAPLLAIGTYRPADAESTNNPVYGVARELRLRGRAVEIEVGALGEDAVARYLSARLGGSDLVPDVAPVLYERAGGNPLFIETIVDSWIEEGHLEPADGGWLLRSPVEKLTLQVPPTLRQLIEQRLDRIDATGRAVLEAASVAGPEFSAALVAAACERDEDEVERTCDTLARHGAFIESRGEEQWPDGTLASRYGFLHDLAQEVLYENLPAGRRARLHRQIGDRLVAAHGSRAAEIAPELASHFARGGDAEQAVRHLQLAAEQALQRSAPREAVDHLSLGLELLRRLPAGEKRDRADCELQSALGPALIGTQGWASAGAEAALVRARELCVELGDQDELGRATFKLATLYEVRGEYRLSERLLEESLRLPVQEPSIGLRVDTHELLACTLFHQGEFDRALEHADTGLSFYDGVYANALTAANGDNPGIACQTWGALSLWSLGYPDQARARALEAVALAEHPSRRHGRATALAHAAIVSQFRLDEPATREFAEAALAAAERRGFTARAAMARILRGWAMAAADPGGEGLLELRRGLELSQATGARMDDPYYLGLLGDACLRGDRVEEGLEALSEALEIVRANRTFFYEPELHRLRGELLLRIAEGTAAEESLAEAVETARGQRARSLELRAAVSVARLRREQGRLDEARALVLVPYEAFTEGFDTQDLQAARRLLDELR